MIVVLIAFASMLAAAAVTYILISIREKNANTTEVDEPLGPEAFLNFIKDSLPRGNGLIYEVSTEIYDDRLDKYTYWQTDREGDFIVNIEIIDPIADETVASCKFNQRRHSKEGVEDRIFSTVEDTLKMLEAERIAGNKEIIS